VSTERFFGSWELEKYSAILSDGVLSYPLGEAAVGWGTYSPDGRMSAHLMRSDREPFGAGRRPGVDDIAADLIVAAASGYIGYCGRYVVDPATQIVSHAVECALIPDWVGTTMVRSYTFIGDDQLILCPPPRGPVVSELRWRRCLEHR
jgi:hypothetical protein